MTLMIISYLHITMSGFKTPHLHQNYVFQTHEQGGFFKIVGTD